MEFDGKLYHFIPNELTIKAGDVVNFHNVSGGPHNVSFWADSVPAGAVPVLTAAMPNQMQPLAGSMLVDQDAVYTISFAGAPVGEYKFYCLPAPRDGHAGRVEGDAVTEAGSERDRGTQLCAPTPFVSRCPAAPPTPCTSPPATTPSRPPPPPQAHRSHSASGSTPPTTSAESPAPA